MAISLFRGIEAGGVVSKHLKNRKGTIAAITAAVAAYLEEEARALAPVMPQPGPVPVFSPWSSSGREEIMRMRMLWQRRIVSR